MLAVKNGFFWILDWWVFSTLSKHLIWKQLGTTPTKLINYFILMIL